ncbi:ATP-binding cassette sub-family A member 17-like [Haemaphysalis longicornis]
MGTALLVLPPLAISQSATLTSTDMELIFLLNLLHGYAALPLVYICSFVFDKPGHGFSALAITFFAIASAGFVGQVFMEHYASDVGSPALTLVIESLLQVLRLLPSYSYSRGMTKILQLAAEKATCQKGGSELDNQCHTKIAESKISLQRCCQHMDSANPSEYAIHPLEVHSYSAFYNFLVLTVEGAVLFALLLYLERKLPKAEQALTALDPEYYEEELAAKPSMFPGIGTGRRKSTTLHDGTDVMKEDLLVAALLPGQISTSEERPLMVVQRLFRAYGYFEPKIVLEGLSFTVRTGECFGLLGVHGVGKTTTFRIMTGEILPHAGNVYVNGLSVVKDTQELQRLLGYCPQRDGLLDMLTGFEMLVLFTRLKGIQVTPDYIDVLLEIFLLEDYADQLVRTYSAGNRRKLSLCIAMMGMPRLLLLDEPYAGMGTTARKRIVSYVSTLQRVAKLSIVLSSHSLSDVEFLCNRIAILDGGRLQCLGSLVHLKEKFGKGYTITVKTYPDKKQDVPYQKEVAEAVMKNFKEADLVHTYEGLLEFRMSRMHLPWSEMFIKMARIKKKFKLQDFFITDTSLEQIFLSVTRKEASDAAAAAAAASSMPHKSSVSVVGTTLGI